MVIISPMGASKLMRYVPVTEDRPQGAEAGARASGFTPPRRMSDTLELEHDQQAAGARRRARLVAAVNTIAAVIVNSLARHHRAVGAAVPIHKVLLVPQGYAGNDGVAVRGLLLRCRGGGVGEE